MKIKITKRQLSDKELDVLIHEVRKFFSPIVGYKDKWKRFDCVYVATVKNHIVGACGIEKNRNWIMLHPFVVLEKYQGQGIGSLLMKKIVSDNAGTNIFFGSQNAALAKIATKNGFTSSNHVFTLPFIVIFYLIKFTLDSINIRFFKALFEKRSMPRGDFKFFIKKFSYHH